MRFLFPAPFLTPTTARVASRSKDNRQLGMYNRASGIRCYIESEGKVEYTNGPPDGEWMLYSE